jgi:uncharacterized lipoprotein NlpE involved in copper resistance
MNRWIKPAAVLAVAAIVAGLTGGAGATNAPTSGASAGSKGVASTAAARREALLRQANLETVAGAKRYLRAIGVDPRGVVIQRGPRNYAGPSCPGARWTCTSTAHPVVQLGTAGGKNAFLCTTGRCVVVQRTVRATSSNGGRALAVATATNTARCVRTTGLTQSCSISQGNANSNDNNEAIVYMSATKASGLTQTGSSTASITQTARGGANTACVYQEIKIDGSTAPDKKGVPVTVTLNATQSVSITQNSASGGNTVQKAAASGSSANCVSGPLTQNQTLSSNATGSARIDQNLNAGATGPNVSLDIEQNQGTGFFGSASGPNNAAFSQTNSLSAIANTQTGPVAQTQSSPSGGILAKINQFSHGVSTAKADQKETQCEHAATSGATTCTAGTSPRYSLTQKQFGPIGAGGGRPKRAGRTLAKVGKGGICPPDCSTQADNPGNTFLVNQSSTQSNDTGQNQTNDVQGDCRTSGGCTVNQTTTVQNQTTTNSQTAQTVSTSITCTGSSCTTTAPIVFDGSPGTNAPPATLGPYTMTAFGRDPQPVNDGTVSGVSDPAGTLSFSPPLNHSTVGNGWATWSHGYTGDVYWTNTGSTITITLPGGTRAFYLYAEPNTLALFNVTATAQDGTTSGPVAVQGDGGGAYFGFYATGTPNIATITVTTTDTAGLGVGEFGISPAATPPPIG